MSKQRIEFTLGFKADTAQAQRELESLAGSLKKLAIQQPNIIDDKQFKEATQAAFELQQHLQKAVDVDTGKLDLTKFSRSLKNSGKQLGDYSKSLQKLGPEGKEAFNQLTRSIAAAEVPTVKLNKHLSNFLTTLKNTAKWQLTSNITHGLESALSHAYTYAQNLNESLTNISIVTGKSTEEMARFAQEANKTAKALSSSTTGYTDASLIYFQQGLSEKEVEERTKVTVKMANVTGQSVETISEQLTSVWNNFDDGTKSLEYYADVLARLGADTASSSDEIVQGLQKFSSVADTIGLSYEYAAASLATITSTTRESADVVGTALKTLFSRIQGLKLGETLEDGVDLNKYSEALDKVGVKVLDQNGKLREMDVILNELGAKWNTIGKAEQTALAQTVAGVRQYTQLMTLMNNWDQVQANVQKGLNSEGSLQEQQDIYAAGWEASAQRVQTALESLYDTLINDEFFIGLNNFLEDAIGGIEGFSKAMGGIPGILSTIGGILLTVFANKIPGVFDNLINGFRSFIGLSRKDVANMQLEAEKLIKSNLATSQSEKMQQDALAKILSMKQKLTLEGAKLTEEERENYEILIQQTEALHNQAIKKQELLEQSQKEQQISRGRLIQEAGRASAQASQEWKAERSALVEEAKSLKLSLTGKAIYKESSANGADQFVDNYHSQISKKVNQTNGEEKKQYEEILSIILRIKEVRKELKALDNDDRKNSNYNAGANAAKEQLNNLEKLVQAHEKAKAGYRSMITQAAEWTATDSKGTKQSKEEIERRNQALKEYATLYKESVTEQLAQNTLFNPEDFEDAEQYQNKIEEVKNAWEAFVNNPNNNTFKSFIDSTGLSIDQLEEQIGLMDERMYDFKLGEIIQNIGDVTKISQQSLENYINTLRRYGENSAQAAEAARQLKLEQEGITHIVKKSEVWSSMTGAIMNVSNALRSAEQSMSVFADSSASGIQKLGAAIGLLTSSTTAITTTFKGFSNAFQLFYQNSINSKGAATGFGKTLESLGAKAQGSSAIFGKMAVALGGGTGAGAGAVGVAAAAGIASAAIAVLIGTIVAISVAHKNWQKAAQESAKAVSEEVKANQELIDKNNELIKSMQTALSAYKESGDNKQELDDATIALAEAYGIEGSAIAALTGNYKDYEKVLKQIQALSKEEYANQAEKAAQAVQSAGDAAFRTGASTWWDNNRLRGDTLSVGFGGFGAGEGEFVDIAQSMLEEVGLNTRDYFTGSGFYLDLDTSNYDELILAYEKLDEVQSKARKEMGADAYYKSGTAKEIDKWQEQIKEYIDLLKESQDLEQDNRLRATGLQFELDEINNYEEYIQWVQKAKEAINSMAESDEERIKLLKQLKSLSVNTEITKFEALEETYDNLNNKVRGTSQEINNFWNNLTDEQKELLINYDIDYATTLQQLKDYIDQLEGDLPSIKLNVELDKLDAAWEAIQDGIQKEDRAILEAADLGIDWVKLFTSGYSEEEKQAIVAEAIRKKQRESGDKYAGMTATDKKVQIERDYEVIKSDANFYEELRHYINMPGAGDWLKIVGAYSTDDQAAAASFLADSEILNQWNISASQLRSISESLKLYSGTDSILNPQGLLKTLIDKAQVPLEENLSILGYHLDTNKDIVTDSYGNVVSGNSLSSLLGMISRTLQYNSDTQQFSIFEEFDINNNDLLDNYLNIGLKGYNNFDEYIKSVGLSFIDGSYDYKIQNNLREYARKLAQEQGYDTNILDAINYITANKNKEVETLKLSNEAKTTIIKFFSETLPTTISAKAAETYDSLRSNYSYLFEGGYENDLAWEQHAADQRAASYYGKYQDDISERYTDVNRLIDSTNQEIEYLQAKLNSVGLTDDEKQQIENRISTLKDRLYGSITGKTLDGQDSLYNVLINEAETYKEYDKEQMRQAWQNIIDNVNFGKYFEQEINFDELFFDEDGNLIGLEEIKRIFDSLEEQNAGNESVLDLLDILESDFNFWTQAYEDSFSQFYDAKTAFYSYFENQNENFNFDPSDLYDIVAYRTKIVTKLTEEFNKALEENNTELAESLYDQIIELTTGTTTKYLQPQLEAAQKSLQEAVDNLGLGIKIDFTNPHWREQITREISGAQDQLKSDVESGLIDEETKEERQGWIDDATTAINTIDSTEESIEDNAEKINEIMQEIRESNLEFLNDIYSEVDAYADVNQELEQIQRNINRIQKERAKLYGQNYLDSLEDETNELVKQEMASQKQAKTAQQLSAYYSSQAKANNYIQGLGAKFDEDGYIINLGEVTIAYEKQIDDLEQLIREAEEIVNSSTATDEQKENAKKQSDVAHMQLSSTRNNWNSFIEDYNKSIDHLKIYEDALDSARAAADQILQQNFERWSYTLELNLEVNDRDLEMLEYKLGKIEDDIYSVGEAWTLTNQQVTSHFTGFDAINQSYESLTNLFNAGQITPAKYAEGLKSIYSKAMEGAKSLDEIDEKMRTFYSDTLDLAIEQINKYTSVLEHQTSILEHYYNLITLINGEADYEKIGMILEGQAKTLENEMKFSTEQYQNAVNAQLEYQAFFNTLSNEDKKKYQANLDAINEQVREAEEEMLSDTEAWAEKLKEILENKMAEAGDILEKTFSGGMGFDSLNDSIDRLNDYQDIYLTKTNQVYEVQKLMRTAQQAADKTDNAAAKQRINNFVQETKKLQEKNKLSHLELEIQQAQYDMLMAQIALEEAKNAKTTVRLRRDSQGNFGYVYTADQEQVAKAEQELADAENRLYNISLEATNEWGQKRLELQQQYADAMIELEERRANGEFETDEMYQQERDRIAQEFYRNMEAYSGQYTIALNGHANTQADAWIRAYEDMMTESDKWNEATTQYLDANEKAYGEWKDEVAKNSAIVDGVLKNTQTEVQKVTDKSEELRKKGNEVAASMWTQVSAAQGAQKEYINLSRTVDDLRLDYLNMAAAAQSALDQISKINSLQMVNPYYTTYKNTNEDLSSLMTQHIVNGGQIGDMKWEALTQIRDEKIQANGNVSAFMTNAQIQQILSDYTNLKDSNPDALSVQWVNAILGGQAHYTPENYQKFMEELEKRNWIPGIKLFDTGGYTGEWGPQGRLAVVHEKELVLKQDDTANFLLATGMLRNIASMIDLNAANSLLATGLQNPFTAAAYAPGTLDQNVTIEAHFPNATDRDEITEAFNTLINTASQYANRKTK